LETSPVFDLIPLAAPADGALVPAEIDATRRFAEAEKAAGTRRGYEADWTAFRAWCAERRVLALPAEPQTMAAYLAASAEAGLRPSTIGRKLAAIRYAHKLAGFTEPPTNSELVKATLRGIRRTLGTAPDRKAPATADVLGAMLKLCPNTLIGARDRALLALGFAGALRRSELVALQVEDLTEVPDGLRVLIPAQQNRPGRAGAGDRDPSWRADLPGRGSTAVARSRRDQQRSGLS
jgi:site-specific recombinase XerD